MSIELQAVIRTALERLNWLYGVGDVISVDYEQSTFKYKRYGCNEEQKKFRLVDGTLYALGHSQKVIDN